MQHFCLNYQSINLVLNINKAIELVSWAFQFNTLFWLEVANFLKTSFWQTDYWMIQKKWTCMGNSLCLWLQCYQNNLM